MLISLPYEKPKANFFERWHRRLLLHCMVGYEDMAAYESILSALLNSDTHAVSYLFAFA